MRVFMSTQISTPISQTDAPVLSEGLRLLDRQDLKNDLIKGFEKTEDHRHLVPPLAHCHRSFRQFKCENDHSWAEAENSCSQRLCPHCSRRRSLILAGRLEKFLVGRTDGLRFAVLAERNSA